MIKLSVKETKWSSLLARTRALIFYISIWIFDFGPVKLPGLSRNGPHPSHPWAFHNRWWIHDNRHGYRDILCLLSQLRSKYIKYLLCHTTLNTSLYSWRLSWIHYPTTNNFFTIIMENKERKKKDTHTITHKQDFLKVLYFFPGWLCYFTCLARNSPV